MIKITSQNERAVYLAAQAIASITEAGPSSQWHGIRSIVRTFDGRVLEARETAEEVSAAVEREVRDGDALHTDNDQGGARC